MLAFYYINFNPALQLIHGGSVVVVVVVVLVGVKVDVVADVVVIDATLLFFTY